VAPPRPAPPAEPARWSRTEIVAVAAAGVFVLIGGLWGLGRQSLSGDEAATWAISGHGAGDLVHVLHVSGGDRAAALYYLVCFGWTRVFGTSVVALRSLSVVVACATVAPFHALARRAGRPRAGAADTLLVTSPFFLTHARTARTYALATLFVVVSSWAFARAVRSGTNRGWAIYVVVTVPALYTHWFVALVAVGQYAALALWAGRRRPWRKALAAGGCVVVGASPIVASVLAGRTGGVAWIAPLSVAEIRTLGRAFTGSEWWVLQLVSLAAIVAGVLATISAVRHARRSTSAFVRLLAATWFLVPVALVAAVSTVKPLLVARYLIVALPGFALLAAAGIVFATRGRLVFTALGVAALVAAGSAGYHPIWAHRHADEDWEAATASVARKVRPGDAIIVFPANAVPGFGYYAANDPVLSQRPGPAWPPVPWKTLFARHPLPASSVLTTAGRVRAPAVWLLVREPGGATVRTAAARPPTLAALRRTLAARFPRRETVAGSPDRTTVYAIRYSAAATG
jgi:hypothetical protein